MAVSPMALAASVAGLTLIMLRLEPSARVLRFEARLAGCAVAVMGVFLAGACCWVVGVGSGPGLLHAGAVNAGALAVMLVALSLALRAIGRAGRAALGLPR